MPPLERRAVKSAARFLLALYLRDLTVLGAERVPKDGPVLLAGRAKDPLLGRLLLLAVSRRPLRMLGEAARFRSAAWGPLLKSAGFLPGDSGLTSDSRRELLSRCEHALVGGDALALFLGEDQDPSGDLAADVCAAVRQRGIPLQVVPFSWTGLPAYPRRGKARLVFGLPFRPEAGESPAGTNPTREVRAALAEEADALDPQIAAWEELDWLERARPLAQRLLLERGEGPPPEGAPAGALLERYRWARLEVPLKLRAAVRSARAYFALGDALGIPLPGSEPRGATVPDRTYLRLIAAAGGFPAALFGWLFLALPHWGATWLGREWAAEKKRPPGLAVLASFCLAAPLIATFQAWLLWELYGGSRTLLFCAVALPACAWALLYSRVRKGFLRALWALIRYRLPGRLPLALEQKKARLLSDLEPLLWMY